MSEPSPPALPPLPRPRRWPRIVLLLVVFLSGGITGAAVGAHLMRERLLATLRDPEHAPDRVLPGIRSELALSEDQARRVDAIVRRRFATMEAIRATSHPQQLAEYRAMRAEVAAELSDEQQQRWAAMCDAAEARYFPHTPGPPPADVLFDNFDRNRDGALTEDEVPPPVWLRLRAADTNGDGKVTREEYETARAKAGR